MRGLAVLFGGLVLAACQPGPLAEAPHARPTIVSLNPCTDAVLAELTDSTQVLALSHYSRDPASASMDVAVAQRFGSVSAAAEETIALRPDLVIASPFLAPATAHALTDAGIRVERVPVATSIAESRAQVERIARLAGREAQGRDLLARIDAALARAVPPSGWRTVPAIVWQSGGIVPGDGSLIADLLRRTGYANSAAARGLRQADYLPLEAVLADPPRLLLIAGNARGEEDRLLSHPALAGLQGTHRARLDASLLWCGGPTIIRATERLAKVRETL